MLFPVCQSAVPYSCCEGTHTIASLCDDTARHASTSWYGDGRWAADRQCGTWDKQTSSGLWQRRFLSPTWAEGFHSCQGNKQAYSMKPLSGDTQISRPVSLNCTKGWRIVALHPFFFFFFNPRGSVTAENAVWPLTQPSLHELPTYWLSPRTS